MRTTVLTALALLSVMSLGACASNGSKGNTANAEIDRLQRECDARGGMLVPSGRLTGREPLDNVCKISGGASTLTPDTPKN